ncbi:MAG TPA: hypothetical protein VFI42_12475 [Thermomicrobiaceae bacterium]|nr:hypothetical protein [Thermomicrobiaceae bacterium]
MALAMRAARRGIPAPTPAEATAETVVDLGDRLLDLTDVRCVRFRPGFVAGNAAPAIWADIEFNSGTVKSVFGPAARRLKAILCQDGITIDVVLSPKV